MYVIARAQDSRVLQVLVLMQPGRRDDPFRLKMTSTSLHARVSQIVWQLLYFGEQTNHRAIKVCVCVT